LLQTGLAPRLLCFDEGIDLAFAHCV
jgi:hypothetical protein